MQVVSYKNPNPESVNFYHCTLHQQNFETDTTDLCFMSSLFSTVFPGHGRPPPTGWMSGASCSEATEDTVTNS